MLRVTARIAQSRRVRERDITRRVRRRRIVRAPCVHRATDRNVVSARLDAASRDNLTGKREWSRDREAPFDEEDTLPHPTIDGEITSAIDQLRAAILREDDEYEIALWEGSRRLHEARDLKDSRPATIANSRRSVPRITTIGSGRPMGRSARRRWRSSTPEMGWPASNTMMSRSRSPVA